MSKEINKEHLREIIKRKKLRIDCSNISCRNYHKVIQNCIFDNVVINENGLCDSMKLKEVDEE